ncbi:MAG: Decaprenyl-phosphate phosphoribosyltransferase [Candidatus Aerophobetes bacterium ADurb.Bin490]|nr:MAG: Decaprenyl-phosphate phosphoribosyltransferase [Candidatus Aerophobetes bacterium ADurb.Bin490]
MTAHVKTISDLLRVKQWIKNLLLFAALLFTGNIFTLPLLLKVITAFFLFCFAASSLYIVNDLKDAKEDRLHPQKKNRPIASGAVGKEFAVTLAVFLALISLSSAYFLNFFFFAVLLSYMVMTSLYTVYLKHLVILDVLTVAAGFVLRPVAGAVVIDAAISPWLLVCTTLLALFVILSKRKHELVTLTDASKHRKTLAEYSPELLDQMISIVTSSTLIAYCLYTFSSSTGSNHPYMMFTIPFVLYGIFRYLYLLHKKNLGGAPELIFLKDIPMIIDISLWVISSAAIITFLK